jgi:hypothetical protein
MSDVSVASIKLIPLVSVQVGSQDPIFLDESDARTLYAELGNALGEDGEGKSDDLNDLSAVYQEAWEAGRAGATFQRPTVWFTYGNLGNAKTRRNVIPVTIKQGTDDILLVGIELSKGGVTHQEPLVKSYRTGTITELSDGHPTTWKVAEAS